MKSFVFITLTLFVVNTTSAQKLVRSGGCIIYEGEKYCGAVEIDQIFSLNNGAYFWYKESLASEKLASNLGLATLGGMATTYLLLSDLGDGDSPDYRRLIFGVSLGFVSCVLGTIGIVQKFKSSYEFKKAINIFNEGEAKTLSSNKRYEINFGLAENGLGWVVSF